MNINNLCDLLIISSLGQKSKTDKEVILEAVAALRYISERLEIDELSRLEDGYIVDTRPKIY